MVRTRTTAQPTLALPLAFCIFLKLKKAKKPKSATGKTPGTKVNNKQTGVATTAVKAICHHLSAKMFDTFMKYSL